MNSLGFDLSVGDFMVSRLLIQHRVSYRYIFNNNKYFIIAKTRLDCDLNHKGTTNVLNDGHR